jgi:L-cysteine desulfidase
MLIDDDIEIIVNILRKNIKPATGCTEPIAVAYAVAAVKEKAKGSLESINIQVDSNIYKNGLMVTIPGTTEKGLIIAGALGFVAGDVKKELRVIESLNEDDIKKAKTLISKGKVNLSIKENCNRLALKKPIEIASLNHL